MNKNNILLKIKREQLLEAGAYDGRYKIRIVEDKKKLALTKRVKLRPHMV